jgi:hypothetical protein
MSALGGRSRLDMLSRTRSPYRPSATRTAADRCSSVADPAKSEDGCAARAGDLSDALFHYRAAQSRVELAGKRIHFENPKM